MTDASMAPPTLDHEQERSPPASRSLSPASLRSKTSPAKKKDTYGRTVMPPQRDPGNGPLQPLHQAASSGDVNKLKDLLSSEEAAEVLEAQAKFGWSPLIVAARAGHAECVKLLTEAGASVGVRDHHGSTALHRAAHYGSVRTIEALIDAGASIEQVDTMGRTPLHVAAGNGCMRAAKCLVRHGASPAARDGPLTDGMLPQEVATMWGEEELAEYLSTALVAAQRRIAMAAKLHRQAGSRIS